MSFSDEFERLLVFVDAGVWVRAAAVTMGVGTLAGTTPWHVSGHLWSMRVTADVTSGTLTFIEGPYPPGRSSWAASPSLT